MSEEKQQKISQGKLSLFKTSDSQFPTPPQVATDTFTDRLAQTIDSNSQPMGVSLSMAIPALVLKVEKAAIPSNGGFRAKANALSTTPSDVCLKLWCHTYFDAGLTIPKNLVNPGAQVSLIYEHFVYEAQNASLDLVIPKVGDFVNVIHPYAYGYKNKVGVYVGKLVEAIPNTFTPTSSNFKKPSKRKKAIPQTLRKKHCETDAAQIRNPTSSPEINAKLKTLHPSFRQKAIDFFNKAEDQGFQLDMVYGFRSIELQNNLYAQGRIFSSVKDKKGRIVNRSSVCTNARGGTSYHNYGLAFDFKIIGYKTCKKTSSVANLKPKQRWEQGMEKMGQLGESLGMTWGGRWTRLRDRPHFQYKGIRWKSCREKLEKGDTFVDALSKQTFINL